MITRKPENEFMEKFEENYFKYLNVLPPSITSHLSAIKVQMSNVSTSSLERYVLKKIESEEEFIEYLNIVLKIVDNFTYAEQQLFKGIFFLGNTEFVLEEQLGITHNTLEKIKKSCIIKFALALNIAILK